MEVYRRRRTDPWIIAAIVAVVAIALLFIVWYASAGSARQEAAERERERQAQAARRAQEQSQREEQARKAEQARQAQQQNSGVVKNQEQVREIVRIKPVYIYEEPPQPNSNAPRSVVVVPQDAQTPSSGYERVNVPAMFTINGRDYIIQTGVPEQGDETEFISTGKQADDHIIYYKQGTTEPRDTLYLRLQPDSNTYIPYQLSSQ